MKKERSLGRREKKFKKKGLLGFYRVDPAANATGFWWQQGLPLLGSSVSRGKL
jgi:hypothetical protein